MTSRDPSAPAATPAATLPRRILPFLVLALLVAAVFGQSVGFRFLHWDDDTNVVENAHLTAGSVDGLARLWKAPYAGLYVPVTYTWWWAQAGLSRALGEGVEPDPRIFHTGNLTLHLGCAWLVFLLLRRLLGSEAGALAGAALWAVHPIQAEVASWVTASKDLLAALFSLAAALLHLRFRESGGIGLRAAAIAAFVLALLAKPSAVAMPALVFLLDALWLRRPAKEAAVALLPWVAIATVLVLVTKAQQPDAAIRFDLPAWTRPLVALDALAFYLAKLFAPVRFLPDYGRTPALVLESGAAAWTWIAPAAVAAAALRFRRDPRWTVPAAWFALSLSPVLGLIPFEYQNISTVADRYAYVALLGPALAAGAIVAARPGRATFAAAGAIALALGLAANRQSARWEDTERLFEHTLVLQPESFTAHNNLGVTLAKSGRYEEALEHFDATIRLAPGYFRAWANRGNVREKVGRPEEALADLEQALRLAPDYVQARLSLARVLDGLGRSEEAQEQLRLAHRTAPGEPESLNSLGVHAFGAGDLEAAEAHFRQALRLRPGYSEAHNNLANTLVRLGRPHDALPHYEEALRIDPDYYSAHLNLGKVLLRSTDQAGALRHLERALELGGPDEELERRIEALRARGGALPPGAAPAAGDDAATGSDPGDQSR